MRSRSLIVAVGLFAAANASAYVLSSANWMWDPNPVSFPWEVNAASFPAAAGSVVEVENAIDGAMNAWNNTGNPYFAWIDGGTTGNLSWARDDSMIVQWHSNTNGFSTLAVTQIWSSGQDTTECDIRFYGANGGGSIRWSAAAGGAPNGEFDVQLVATHELGHCLGLNHSANSNAIMYDTVQDGTGPGGRVLHSDDVNGLNAIYTAWVPRPDLDLASFTTNDLGDGDGYFEAGEIVEVVLEIDNEADVTAINARGTLSTEDPNLQINNATGRPTDPDHPGLETREYFGAELRISPNCTEEDGEAEYEIVLSGDNYVPAVYWTIDLKLTCLGPDLDDDGVPESEDICEGGKDHKDRDGDGIPNKCDDCPDDATDDSDGDGVCDIDDVCDGFDDTLDDDQDGTPNDCDEDFLTADQTDIATEPSGCACSSTQRGPSPWMALLVVLAVARRKQPFGSQIDR